MKKILVLLVSFVFQQWAFACPACEKNQPAILRGITHGTGPDSNWDFVIIGVTVLIVTYCFTITLFRLLKPGENSKNHIKHLIFKE